MTGPPGARIVVFAPDLMDRSKITAVAPDAVVVRQAGDLAEHAHRGVTVVVDLSRPGVLDVLAAVAATGSRVIGFGSHVERETLAAAQSAGCSEVLARSAFFGRLPELLA